MKTILVKGPALSRSGYGEQTRFALRSLRAHEERFNILLQNIPWGKTGWITDNGEERDFLICLEQGSDYSYSTGLALEGEYIKRKSFPKSLLFR